MSHKKWQDKFHMTQTPSGQVPATRKELLRAAAKPFFFLLLLTMVCGFLARALTGSETLEQYARNNPEAAYGSADGGTGSAQDAALNDAQATQNPATDAAQGTQNTAADDAQGTQNTAAGGAQGTQDATAGAAGTADEAAAYDRANDPAAGGTESDAMELSPERVTYQDGFYYEPLNESIKQKITGVSYPENGCTVPYEDLRYVGILYRDFDGQEQAGELICNKAVAQDLVEIFYELYLNDYRLERVRLIDEYGGDDTLSMQDNNTSCFNYRVIDGTDDLSKHAYGCAVDINPFYNPYVVYNKNGNGEPYISPEGSEIYADRSQNFPYKIDENDLCYKLFTQHGFTWGGNWNATKDYQHFQIALP